MKFSSYGHSIFEGLCPHHRLSTTTQPRDAVGAFVILELISPVLNTELRHWQQQQQQHRAGKKVPLSLDQSGVTYAQRPHAT